MTWLYVCGAVFLTWISVFALMVTTIGIQEVIKPQPDPALNPKNKKIISLIAFVILVFAGYAAYELWIYIDAANNRAVEIYLGIWILAFFIRIITLGLNNNLGYLAGGYFEPEWSEIWWSIVWASGGPLVLFSFFSAIWWKIKRWKKDRE